ncbi:major facilitator superfamily domain-containing protein [Aspergillus desertorum]
MDVEDQQARRESYGPYQTPPGGIIEWLFLLVLCSTQLFVQGAFGYILLPLHVVGKTFDQGADDATKMTWHVGGYSLTGIGPAFLLPNALAIAGRTYPPGKKKNMIFSAFAMAAPLGCSTAGAIGAAFAEYAWWPWVMWLYGIGCFVLAGVALWVVPSDSHMSRQSPGLSFDYIGSCLGVTGLLLLNISWNQAPIDGWSTPYFGVWFYYLFQLIQDFRHVSPMESAAQFAPGAISGVVAALTTTYLISVISSGWLMDIACRSFLTGCLLMGTAPIEQSYWMKTFWSFVVMAWRMDISFPGSATILSDAVPIKHQGASASLINTVINYSIAIGLGNRLMGYRAALWTSVGLSALAFSIALLYVACTDIRELRRLR